jgi:multidrug efflux pump subunit AcrB
MRYDGKPAVGIGISTVLVLLLTMGLRSGLIIGAVLFMTICGTFILMDMWAVTLERISLGMLVDNAIVVTDGMKAGVYRNTTNCWMFWRGCRSMSASRPTY